MYPPIGLREGPNAEQFPQIGVMQLKIVRTSIDRGTRRDGGFL
jgi:hypothetical protein